MFPTNWHICDRKEDPNSLYQVCVFLGRIEKPNGRPGLWLAETFSTSPLKPLNGIQWNLTGRKISTSSTKFVFFGPTGKTEWPPWTLIGWDIFDFSSETAERNSTKLDRKQDLNVFYQVCVFRADRKNKMAALASDWLRHCQLLFWNHWTEFNENWQEARSQHPLPSLCFPGRSEKQDGRPGLWMAETFLTSPLKLLNGIQLNLTGSKISTSSTKFVFFWPIGKTKWPPWPLIGWDIFDFSSETAERNSTKLDRKQDLNVFYQVCVFRADRKNKMADLVSDWLRHFRFLLWNRWTEFNETWQEARSQRPLFFRLARKTQTKFVFFGPIGKTRWPPWPLIGWDIFYFFSEPLNGIQWNLTGSNLASSQCPLPSLYFSGRSVNNNGRPGRFIKKVANCTQVHDMWPFGPLVSSTGRDQSSLCNTLMSVCKKFLLPHLLWGYLSQRLLYSPSLLALWCSCAPDDLVSWGPKRERGHFHYISLCKSCYRISS